MFYPALHNQRKIILELSAEIATLAGHGQIPQIGGDKMKLLNLCVVSLFLPLIVRSAEAAVTIDFQSLAAPGTSWEFPTSPYTEDGFQLDAVNSNFASAQTGNVGWYAGSTSLFNNSPGGLTTLTKIGGGGFDLNSIELSEVSTEYPGSVTVTFTGTKLDNSLVNQSFILDEVFGFQTFAFSASFLGVKQVDWAQSPQYHQFDNVVLNADAAAVPEPLSLLVWGVAILGAVPIARRFKSSIG